MPPRFSGQGGRGSGGAEADYLFLRVRGKGMPVASGCYGDLLVNLRIVVPKHLSAREWQLFEEFANESRFDPRV